MSLIPRSENTDAWRWQVGPPQVGVNTICPNWVQLETVYRIRTYGKPVLMYDVNSWWGHFDLIVIEYEGGGDDGIWAGCKCKSIQCVHILIGSVFMISVD